MSGLSFAIGGAACATGQRTLTLKLADATYPVTVRMCMSLVKLPPSGVGTYYISELAFAFKAMAIPATGDTRACTTSTTCPTCPTGYVRVVRDLNTGTPRTGTLHNAIVACYKRSNNAALVRPVLSFTTSRYTTCSATSRVALRTPPNAATPANLNFGSGISMPLYVCQRTA